MAFVGACSNMFDLYAPCRRQRADKAFYLPALCSLWMTFHWCLVVRKRSWVLPFNAALSAWRSGGLLLASEHYTKMIDGSMRAMPVFIAQDSLRHSFIGCQQLVQIPSLYLVPVQLNTIGVSQSLPASGDMVSSTPRHPDS